MQYDQDGRKKLTELQARATAKLAEIRRLMVPDLNGPCTTTELCARAERHFQSLSPREQEVLRLKAIVAHAELDRLMATLTNHLNAIGDELHSARARMRATEAYHRAPLARGYAATRH